MLTPADVAALRGLNPRAVRNACADGSLPATRIGRQWFISAEAANQWTPRPMGWSKGRKRTKKVEVT
jgi:excisionase family DNA binding protein